MVFWCFVLWFAELAMLVERSRFSYEPKQIKYLKYFSAHNKGKTSKKSSKGFPVVENNRLSFPFDRTNRHLEGLILQRLQIITLRG